MGGTSGSQATSIRIGPSADKASSHAPATASSESTEMACSPIDRRNVGIGQIRK